MLKPTPKERVLFVRRFMSVLLVLFGVFSLLLINFARSPGVANAAAANTINFQARLQTAAGGIVPDGTYNVEFKLYDASSSTGASQGSCTGDSHCVWVESRTGANKVQVINGYLSVNLGSVTAFGSINWDQQLWMTMNIGGTGTASWDGEMSPRLSLTAVPAAFSASQLNNTDTGGRSSLTFQGSGSGHGDQSFVLQDQGAAGTYNILTAPGGSDGYIKLQGTTPGTQQTGNLNVSGTGIFGTAVSTAQLTATGQSILGGGSDQTQLIVKANASQSASNPLIMLQDSGGSELARISATGSGDTYFGWRSGVSQSGGSGLNTGIGGNALSSLTTGANNTAIGEEALTALTTGNNNTALGQNAAGTVTGSFNVAIGQNSLGGVVNSGGNVAIGSGAGAVSGAGSSFYNNVFLGYAAGSQDSDTFVTTTTLQNSTAIGFNSQVQANNTIVLGGIGTDAQKVVIGSTMGTGSNLFGVSPVIYTTGTASQSGSTISGSGTTWNSANGVRVGMRFIFADGTDGGTITAVNSTTSLTVDTSQTVGSQKYRIHNVGFQVTNTGDAYVRSTSTSAFSIQDANAGTLFTANTSTGTITLGNSGSGNYITFTASGGLTAYGTSQHTKSIVLAPEYTNAVLDAASDSSCSSANNGTLTSLYDSTNYRNYYNWTSTQGTDQCYDVVVDVTLPNDFSSWASSDPINLQALASNTSNAGYAIAVRNVTGAAWDGNYGSGYASPGSISTSWSDVASSAFSGTYNAGDRLSIKVRMTAKSSANLQLGNLTLNYNSKW